MQIRQSIANFSKKHLGTKDDFGEPQNREVHTLLAATSAGVAVGAVSGGLLGFKAMGRAESLETVDISDPVFEGHNYWRVEDTSETCTDYVKREGCITWTDGYWHKYSPKYQENIVGTFEKPSFETVRGSMPILGALGGAAIGGFVGVVSGAIINAVRKSSDSPPAVIPREKSWEISDQNSRILSGAFWGGTIGGAAIGALVGRHEVNNTPVETRSYVGPDTVKTEMGLIPDTSYSNGYENRSDAPAVKPVYRDLPQYGSNGEVLMKEKTEDFANARFGPWKGALYGGVMGGIAGVATGATVAVLNRMSHYETPKET